MPNIKITVAGKVATNTSPGVVIVCGNSDYVVNFTFDSEWNGQALKTARFVFHKGGAVLYKEVPFSGNTVTVPVLSDVREVFVGVYAGDLHTTTPARINCNRSILCGTGTEHEEPDPDVYSQILAACNKLIGVGGNHPTRTDNPHGVTAAQVGAAPAGYGLGATCKWLDDSVDIDTLITNGWFSYGENNTSRNKPGGGNADIFVIARTANIATQIAVASSYVLPTLLVRKYSNGVWSEWEWVNPPMSVGVEYRTTERWGGKPVYAKAVSVGALPNKSTKNIAHGIGADISIVSVSGTDSNGAVIPRIYSTGGVYVGAGSASISIETTEDVSDRTAVIHLKYTKGNR